MTTATIPVQFSTEGGTITGTLDGVNDTFHLPYPLTTANVYRNGLLMTNITDSIFAFNLVVFQAGQIPIAGDVITVEGWV